MLQQLSNYYSHKIAGFLLGVFYLSIIFAPWANAAPFRHYDFGRYGSYNPSRVRSNIKDEPALNTVEPTEKKLNRAKDKASGKPEKANIGGPSQPEMSSFKSVGTSDMVNLFTGDFSYNIPLLDVGGYPVNIYYDGGIGSEQEASWVGLGWNINPGNINRNMRGVPDDFNGNDTLVQEQIMKPNRTWGFGIGGDLEVMGLKQLKVGGEVGVSFNNYLGPSLDLALRGNASLKIGTFGASEKGPAVKAGVNFGIDINSRSGTSFSGGVSLTAIAQAKQNAASFGVGLSTGYNSRSGIKALQIAEQVSFSSNDRKEHIDKDGDNDYDYDKIGSINHSLFSNSISFAKPSYCPAIRMPLTNTAWSGHFQLGLGSYGVAADVEAEVFGQKSEVASADVIQKKPMVGYLYYQNVAKNPNYVMDFTRFNDKEVTPNTPVISVPQYTYDVFSIQGEGTGGSIRLFRNDLGYIRDNITTSKDVNVSLGADIDPPGHYGGNFNFIATPSTIGDWNTGNKLRNSIQFTKPNGTFENVYFRNPGENCVIDSNRFSQIGGTSLVRFVLGGSNVSPSIESKLQTFDDLNATAATIDLTQRPVITERNKRTQVVSYLSAQEASVAGLDKVIKSYDNQNFLDNVTDTLLYESIPRVDGVTRKAHHISQINVTENNGKRYVYGIPVYNLAQKDFTFSVDNSYSQIPDKINLNDAAQATTGSPLLLSSSSRDGYVQITTTPAYAHSFLLSGILSPDYVDVTGDGITEDDLGNAVKFNYSRIKNGTDIKHKWRTPLTSGDSANFNAGSRSEVKDDKGIISYGERESWYVQSVESKTMIALFYVSGRLDGKGASGQDGGINSSENFIKKLDSIALYSKADLKANGLAKAKPIKTVHFVYSYLLCQNTPDNPNGTTGNKGKLTLQNIYYTYNGKTRAFKNKYTFTYNSTGSDNKTDNPDYAFAASDRWGTYKPSSLNPGGIKNSDYPYSVQDTTSSKSIIDKNASAWMLKKIVLPSGGQIEVNYETDDYAFVQNKRASDMMSVVGFGNTPSYSSSSNSLYPFQYPSSIENDYVFIRVPIGCSNTSDVYVKYLQGLSQLAFKIWVLMPKGPEYMTCYASYSDYGVDASSPNIIWVKMNRLGGKSPLSITTLEYLRQQLPGQAFAGYDVSGEPTLKQVGDMLLGMLKGLRDAFTDPVNAMRKDSKAMHTDLNKCFVRLNDPDGFKYGGGYRVKSVTLKDNWNAMTGQYTSSYGQKYDYTTTENFNGVVRKISSGVASYEPSIGGEENPFQSILQVQDYLPAGPTSFGAIEMPVLDAFFPSPLVGYSKVTVSSLKSDTSSTKKTRSGIGKQVTEYYTAKDFPVYYNNTPFDANSVKEFHQASTTAFFNKYAYDYKALSQGFLIATNDMHGKMKSQSSYAENDTATRISYTENFYRNNGTKGLNEKFSFINKDNSGTVYQGNMGIDVDLMTDAREFSIKSSSMEVQGQVDLFYVPLPVPIPTIWPVSGVSQNIYRAVTTTKVINYHSILDSVVVIVKGSQVSTKNLAYDAQTGEVLVTRTNNGFNKAVYNTTYPAYWAYGGMGLAYKNIDATYTGINFSDGRITNAGFDLSVFESGDELLIKTAANPSGGCDLQIATGTTALVWAYDKNKNYTSLITTPDLIFMDANGKPYTMYGVSFRIIRSGHRNLLDAKTGAVTSMSNPLATGKLYYNPTPNSGMVINASASEYKEKWQTDNDVIRRLKLVMDSTVCPPVANEVVDSTGGGYLEKSINPYRKGLLGNFRPYRSFVYYDTRAEYDTTASTNIGANGFMNNFKLYWDFNLSNNLVPDTASARWVWNSKLNKVNAKGLELETQDALGIYTSAQYGYNKTVPVAITSNSRCNEMFAEGFEDYGYGESLDNAKFNLGKKQIDFSNIAGCGIVNTDSTTFKAHSGRYVLGVGANSQVLKTVKVNTVPYDSFNLGDVSANTNVETTTPNGTYQLVSATPTNAGCSSVFSYWNLGLSYNLNSNSSGNPIFQYDAGTNSSRHYRYYTASQNIKINTSGIHSFTLYAWQHTTAATWGQTIQYDRATISFIIRNSNNQLMYSDQVNGDNENASQHTGSVYLPCGSYTVEYSISNDLSYQGSLPVQHQDIGSYMYLQSTGPAATFFSYCYHQLPIAGNDSMLNPVFSPQPNKKMLFSGWVKEACGNATTPCFLQTYANSSVNISFSDGTSIPAPFIPVGPIIDGWQKIEGNFVVPAGDTTMTLKLINSSTMSSVYFDDIRVHPFNANMKSYVYDPVNLRLMSELDANNYAAFYEYDEEGTLIRTKVETREGIKTVNETRSSLQKIVQ